jgi:hypothetical protein
MPETLAEAWPSLPLDAWRDTRDTLHMLTQIVGKTRLALAPRENHWWQVALYVTARGLATSPMPCGEVMLEAEFDLSGHNLWLRTSAGEVRGLPLVPRPVADFYEEYLATLRAMQVEVRLLPRPVEVVESIPFAEDRKHGAYDAEWAHRFWQALVQADRVLKAFRGRFLGKASPVHFFWGSFDLAATRFSGRPAPPHPGGAPNLADWVMREAYSHELSSAGFWPGDDRCPEPAFYAYAYPEPAGFKTTAVRPGEAFYSDTLGEFILPYEAVRSAADPDRAILDFLQSTYEAAAVRGRWDRAALERSA